MEVYVRLFHDNVPGYSRITSLLHLLFDDTVAPTFQSLDISDSLVLLFLVVLNEFTC